MKKAIVITTMFIVLVAAIAGEATAQSYSWAHGIGAKIGNPGNVASSSFQGLGLILDQKLNTSGWVYMGIQSPIGMTQADRIQLFCGLMTTNISITQVTVYNGAFKVKDLLTTPFTTSNPGYYFYQEIQLGEAYDFSKGMGVGIQIKAGKKSNKSHRFTLASVGASWLTIPTAPHGQAAPLQTENASGIPGRIETDLPIGDRDDRK